MPGLSWLRTRFARSWHVVLVGALVAGCASPLLGYQLPNTTDELTESYEPLHTLKFVAKRGRIVYKWGSAPSLIYAPLYAPPMAYWMVRGDIRGMSYDFPYGLARPHEQFGLLIGLTRLAGLVVGIAAASYLTAVVAACFGSRRAALLGVILCLATSSPWLYSLIATKPDGLMVSFLVLAMAAYTQIVVDGLTMRRGIALSVWAVLSISCKLQTAPAFVLPYLAIGLDAWWRSRSEEGRPSPWLRDYLGTLAAGVVAYALVNVVYAPAQWWTTIRFWLVGPGKDPAVWAPPGYTWSQYLLHAWSGAMENLGVGGSVAVGVSLAALPLLPARSRWLLWLPAASYTGILLLTAGYMPPYFLTPLVALVVPPVVATFACLGRTRFVSASPAGRIAVALGLAACLIPNLWGATATWVLGRNNPPWLIEQAIRTRADRSERIHLMNLHALNPGAHRLEYLGYHIDPRPLGLLVAGESPMPDLIITNESSVRWLGDARKLPARAAMLRAETGFAYDLFPGLESLGYRRVDRIRGTPPTLLGLRWQPQGWNENHVVVYRRERPSAR